jgi:hypothetical protein
MDDRWSTMYPNDVDDRKLRRGPYAPPEPKPYKPINVVMPTWKGDQDQAIRLLKWIGELGFVQAPFFLACSDECEVEKMLDLARKSFSVVTWIRDGEKMVSNWNEVGDHPKSAAGPNSLFRQIAWHFGLQKLGPWFFLEPDCGICRRDWYDVLNREYQICGKPFMGFHVQPKNHPGVPDHMSGVAVYPEDMISRSQKAIEPSETAFDIAGREDMLPNAHFTSLIKHHYRAPGFHTQEDFDSRVDSQIAIYHANKDGTIFPFLRKRLGLEGIPAAESIVVEKKAGDVLTVNYSTLGNGAGNPYPTVDIFIKTRPHDYPWLEWCLKSITKFGHEPFRGVVILTPEKTPFTLGKGRNEIVSPDQEPGYLWQQVCKLNADQYTDAEWILYMDSDCVFTRDVTPSNFIKDGKPVWLYTPLDQARPDQHQWVGPMEKFLGKKPEHELMRRHPFVVHRSMLEEFRNFTKYRHGKTIEQYIMGEAVPNSPTALVFSEWNCLGFFLWEFHHDKIHWVKDTEAEPACVYQGFTHGGEARKQEDIAKFKEILDGSTPLVGHKGEQEVTSPASPLTEEAALKYLAQIAKDNPKKARIIRALKKEWGTEKPKKKKVK